MSQKNVEVVRRAWDAWSRRNLDGVLDLCGDDVVWDTTRIRDWPDNEYTGHDGVRRFLSEWLDVWDEFETSVDEVIPAADDRVLALYWMRGKGRRSGLMMDVAWALVTEVRDGRLARIDIYGDTAEALKAVGLEEQAVSQEHARAVVTASIEAYNKGDLDAQMATYHPAVVAITHQQAERLLPGIERRTEGQVALRRLLSELRQAWFPRYEPTEIRVLSEDTVVSRGPIGGEGASTGLTLFEELSVVFTLRDGVIGRVEFFESHTEALKAVGLEE